MANMAKRVGVFLSFEFDKDRDLHRNFYAQAKRHSKHRIRNDSLNEKYHPNANWLNKARNKIKQSDIVIVVIGDDSHNAPGIKKEVGEANKMGKPIFQIKPKPRKVGKVKGAKEMIPWKWKLIDAKIDELLPKQNKRRRNRSRANRAKSRQRS